MATDERLANVRERIRLIREALADPSTLSEITIDGVTEKFDRTALRAELRELEVEEARLTGSGGRLYGIRL